MSMHYEAFTWSNVSTSQTFVAKIGGRFSFDVIATWGGGSVDIQKLAQDGSTYVTVLPATFGSNTVQLLDLAPGSYKVVITTATAVYACLSRVQLGD